MINYEDYEPSNMHEPDLMNLLNNIWYTQEHTLKLLAEIHKILAALIRRPEGGAVVQIVKPKKLYFSVKLSLFIEVMPCYCGGHLWISLDEDSRKDKALNCYPYLPMWRRGWVRLKGIEL